MPRANRYFPKAAPCLNITPPSIHRKIFLRLIAALWSRFNESMNLRFERLDPIGVPLYDYPGRFQQ